MCVNQILPEIHAAVEGGKLTERNVHVYFEGKKRWNVSAWSVDLSRSFTYWRKIEKKKQLFHRPLIHLVDFIPRFTRFSVFKFPPFKDSRF